MAFPYFILGLALLLGFVFAARWFVNTDPKKVVKAARWALIVIGVALLLALIVFNRQLLFLFIFMALMHLLVRRSPMWQRVKAAAGPKPGQASEISTRFLKMTLDHDSGEMSGEVLDGRFSGRRLDELTLEQLIELWRECQAEDRQSAVVLEAYLDRTQGDAWREAAGAGPREEGASASGAGGAMSRDEACAILGVESGASEAEIRAAHRRLMQKVHPDHGGSNYLAAKINQAKDLLLGE